MTVVNNIDTLLSIVEREQFQSDIFGNIIKICKGQESVTCVLHQ